MSKDSIKALVAPIARLLYNSFFTYLPSRHLRKCVLFFYLKKLGRRCGIQRGVYFMNAHRVSFGDHVVINFGTFFDGRHYDINVGNNVSIGPEASILTLGHDPQSPTFENRGGAVSIGDYAWIGFRASILPNVVIGEGAIIGANAVVTQDVAPYMIVAGNPAKVIGTRCQNLEYCLNFDPWLL